MSASVDFTHIVLTAPSEKIASVYRLQIESLKSSLSFLESSTIYCVSDPEGCRVGSGGGTFNALDYLVNCAGLKDMSMLKVLIIHSGGDSRRAPLYSLCGKAWTTLNSQVEEKELASPMLLLIQEIYNFCAHLPLRSLVVSCSDCLLDFCKVDTYDILNIILFAFKRFVHKECEHWYFMFL